VTPSGSGGKLAEIADGAVRKYRAAMDRLALHEGTAAAFQIIDAANEYIAETEPWALARDENNAARLSEVLYDVAEAVRVAGVLLLPIMPKSAAEILRRVGERTPAKDIRIEQAGWRNEGERTILKGDALWPRIERTTVTDQRTPNATTSNPTTANTTTANPTSNSEPRTANPGSETTAPTDQITIDDFMKIDLRVARVLAAEKVPNSRKLMKLSIDAGTEQRTLVAGIAEAYEPEQLVGKTVGIVFNLKPAKLMGIESNGMILAASPAGGKPVLVSFDANVPPGSRIR